MSIRVVDICQTILESPNGTFTMYLRAQETTRCMLQELAVQSNITKEMVSLFALRVSHQSAKAMYMKPSMVLRRKNYQLFSFFRTMDMVYLYQKKIRKPIIKSLITFCALRIYESY